MFVRLQFTDVLVAVILYQSGKPTTSAVGYERDFLGSITGIIPHYVEPI